MDILSKTTKKKLVFCCSHFFLFFAENMFFQEWRYVLKNKQKLEGGAPLGSEGLPNFTKAFSSYYQLPDASNSEVP